MCELIYDYDVVGKKNMKQLWWLWWGISESQNHWDGRATSRQYSPSPLLEQSRLWQVAQNYVQSSFEYLQGWRLHNLSAHPVPLLDLPHSKQCFLVFGRNFICVNLCSWPLVLSLALLKRAWLSLLHCLLSGTCKCWDTPWAFSGWRERNHHLPWPAISALSNV